MSQLTHANFFEIDFSGRTFTRKRQRNSQRLRGGSDKNEIDEIDVDDDAEEEAAPSKKKFRFVEPEPEPEEPPSPPVTLLNRMFYYSKLILFLFIWIVIVVFFCMVPDEKLGGYLATVEPGSYQDLPMKDDIKWVRKVGLFIVGPFSLGSYATDVQSGNANDLIVVLQRIQYDNTGVEKKFDNISNSQYFQLLNTTDFDHVTPNSRQGLFNIKKLEKVDSSGMRMRLFVSGNLPVTVKVFLERGSDYESGIILGALVLVFLYISIVWELANRTFVSILAATLALSAMSFLRSRPTLSKVVSWIDMETLMLLFGMMVLVGILSDSGIFDYFAVYAYQISKGHIWPLVNSLCFFTAFLSAYLDSVTMMLLITPIVIKLCEVMQSDPVLVLMFLVIYANVGAACTPVGDPPNIIITTNAFISANNVNFGTFMLHCVPCVILVLLQTYVQLRCTFRTLGTVPFEEDEKARMKRGQNAWKRAALNIAPYTKDTVLLRNAFMRKAKRIKKNILKIGRSKAPTANYAETLALLQASYGIRNKPLLIKSLVAFTFAIIMFFTHSIEGLHHLTLGWAALVGAILLLVISDAKDMESILQRVEWSTLIFFAALFILMQALTEIGLIDELGRLVENLVSSVEEKYRLLVAILLLLWVSAVASAFLDNIPVTTMMLRIVIALSLNKELQLPLHPMVWALAMGACFGGSGTLIGASANVVSAGVAEQHGYPFTFKRFFIVGFPVMLGNIVVTSVYLIICHVVLGWHDPPFE